MASHVQTETRKTVTRKALDIDPKIIAAGVVALVAAVILVVLYLGGTVNIPGLSVGGGGLLLTVVAGYVKKSSHGDLVEEIADDARDIADAAAPVVDELAPQAAPVVKDVEDAVDELAVAFGTTPTAR